MSDQLVAETSSLQHTALTTDKYPCPGGIRTHDLSRRAAADIRLRPRGHWDRLVIYIYIYIYIYLCVCVCVCVFESLYALLLIVSRNFINTLKATINSNFI